MITWPPVLAAFKNYGTYDLPYTTMPDAVQPESLELTAVDIQESYDINSEIKVNVVVTPEDADLSSLEYVVDGTAVVLNEEDVLTGIEPGISHVYVKSGAVNSNILTITVVDKATEAEKIAAEQAAKEAEEKALKEAEEKLAKEKAEREAAEAAAKEAEEKLAAEQAEKEAAEAAAKEAEEKLAKEQAEKEAAEAAAKEAEEKLAKEQAEKEAAEAAAKEAEKQAAEAAVAAASAAAVASGSQNVTAADSSGATAAQEQAVTYVLNKNTEKFHKPGCSSVKDIKPENYATSSGTRDEVIAQGYEACKRCNP